MRDFVHVSDVARANLAALDRVSSDPPGAFAAYNVCSGQPISILDVARSVAAGSAQGLEPEVTGGFRAGDVRHVVASPERARAELGFSARVSPDQGLAEFATAPLRA
jgi:dTDP-L-rhamnose 4-epimerase